MTLARSPRRRGSRVAVLAVALVAVVSVLAACDGIPIAGPVGTGDGAVSEPSDRPVAASQDTRPRSPSPNTVLPSAENWKELNPRPLKAHRGCPVAASRRFATPTLW